MLKLIETELLKLRRRKLLLIMLLAALIMPFFAMLLFRYKGETGINPLEFYRQLFSCHFLQSFILVGSGKQA